MNVIVTVDNFTLFGDLFRVKIYQETVNECCNWIQTSTQTA